MAPDPATRRETTVYWVCAGLTLLVGLFAVAGWRRDSGTTSGLTVALFAVGGLAIVYVACAARRTRLDSIVFGRVSWFHLTVVAVGLLGVAYVLLGAGSTTWLSVLLPFGLSYWFGHLPVEREP